MKPLDASDPGKAALINYAAAWLYTMTAAKVAFNAERERQGYAAGYDEKAFVGDVVEADSIARGGGALFPPDRPVDEERRCVISARVPYR